MSDWQQRATDAEANLQNLKQKVLPLVKRSKELEAEAAKWKQMYETAAAAAATTANSSPSPSHLSPSLNTLRKNPSAAKKITLEDGSEISYDHVQKLQLNNHNAKIEIETLKLLNTYLQNMMKKVSVTQYFTKEQFMESSVAEAIEKIDHFIGTIQEEVDLSIREGEEGKEEAERVERLAGLKAEVVKLKKEVDVENAEKISYKKELRATKRLAKEALERVVQLEAELKEEKEQAKKTVMDLKVQLHTFKTQVPAPNTDSKVEISSSLKVPETRSRADSTTTFSSIAATEENQIEGGVGQNVVHLKEKHAAKGSRKGQRYEAMRDSSGTVLTTGSGLKVIDTNKKVEKVVSHEMSVAKLVVVEGKGFKPKKMPSNGIELYFKLEMGSAMFAAPPIIIENENTNITWNKEFAYVLSTGLQSKPIMPITVFYRRLHKKTGQPYEGEGSQLGVASIPLTTFLPLIGSTERVEEWVSVLDKDSKEVRGMMKVIMGVDSNVSVSERMLPKDDGFGQSSLRANVTGTMNRSEKIMAEAAAIPEIVDCDEVQQAVSAEHPDLYAICEKIVGGFKTDLNWKNFRKQSWAHIACMTGNVHLLKACIENCGGDLKVVDTTDKAGFSPFLYAVMNNHLKCAEMLKHLKGLNTMRTDWNQNSPLHLAAMYGRPDMVSFLIKDCHNSIDSQDENAATPLHHAAFNGHEQCVKILCAHQAMINAEDRDGNSPLLFALLHNHVQIAKFLKDDKKADIGAFNVRGDSCLWATIQNRNEEMTSLLLKDPKTDLSRKFGFHEFTLLMRCLLQLDHALCDKVVGIILSFKPDVNIQNKRGQTALFFAVAMDRPNMVTFLVAACGALVKIKDKSNNTPLHFCSNSEIAKTLIAHGAQPNIPNVQGNTPLHCAFAFGGPSVADVMLSAGGDMTKVNQNGLTPADCVMVDQKYITLPFYEEDVCYEHTIFIGKESKDKKKK